MDFSSVYCFMVFYCGYVVLSSPGRSPGRAIVIPPALALALVLALASAIAKSLTLKFFM